MSLPSGMLGGMTLVYFLSGLLLGVLGSWLVLFLLRRGTDDAGQLRGQLESSHQALTSVQAELAGTQQQLSLAQGRLWELERRREEDSEAARERETLVEMLHPVRQGVTEMHRRVQELETERAAQHSRLSQQLTSAAETDARIIESTQALLGSLHSTSARGHWGEVQLRRVVESAGMLPHVDFTEQHSGRGADGQLLIPDMVVHLPGGRQLVLDAKAPLNPTDPKAQAKALRFRVDELAKKRYWEAVDLSPDVVFCFVPAESLLSAAMEADPMLLDDALSKGVTLVSPASLLASLKAVSAAWRQERLAQNIREVVDHSRDLYRRLAKMSEHLARTGDRLRQAVTAYNGLIGNIERQVLPKVEAMSRLEVSEPTATSTEGLLEDLGETLSATTVNTEVNPLGPRLEAERSQGQ
ncbi:DNA recombination protein RmuC [Nesterenkonia sp. CF4.4]|uniref:DNA recombination protein RmuC n=1 Tax=Nesterenkonia sp. CF4.4 TaxID=3373079 RepID=UPI003EE5AFF7